MGDLTGKKVLCFLALPHHNRFLVPIMEALQGRGMEVIYFTVPAEGAFEITLNQANLPYRHILDYADAVAAEKSEIGYREIRDIYQQKILTNPVLQSVPVVIQDKVIRSAVENYNAMERMIECEKPDLLFALHEINPWGKMLGYLSHVHQVPFFTLQEGLYYSDLYYYRFHTDFSTACLVCPAIFRNMCQRFVTSKPAFSIAACTEMVGSCNSRRTPWTLGRTQWRDISRLKTNAHKQSV
jgi:hypothetical protein